jgi:hypothetical protein
MRRLDGVVARLDLRMAVGCDGFRRLRRRVRDRSKIPDMAFAALVPFMIVVAVLGAFALRDIRMLRA